jgi:glucose-1-phosphate cytidylyltransferase
MRVVILAGGLGSRLAEHTDVRPKPMVEVGGKPLLWHIMKAYAHYGFREFVVALGYKGEVIKKYFSEYRALQGNMTVRLLDGTLEVHDAEEREDWVIHLVDTGIDSMTGGRLRRLQRTLGKERFMLTYGDGVADVDFRQLLAFHERVGRIATVTAVRPPARFGGLVFDGDLVSDFVEKPQIGEGWINGGFMVLEPGIFDLLSGDQAVLETEGLERLAQRRELAALKHQGFWQCVDTLRELKVLEGLWQGGAPPWKVWSR